MTNAQQLATCPPMPDAPTVCPAPAADPPAGAPRDRAPTHPTDAVQDLGWDEVRMARAALVWLVEPGHRTLGRMVREHGPVETLHRVLGGAVPDRLATAVSARLNAADPLERAAHLAAETRRLGCRLVVPEDEEWPAQLDDLARLAVDRDPRSDPHSDPPLCLWVRGDAPVAETLERSVAIVGARAATSYGTHVATDLAFGLADRVGPWCRAARTGSTARHTAAPSAPAAPRWRCSRPVSTSSTRWGMPTSSTASAPTDS